MHTNFDDLGGPLVVQLDEGTNWRGRVADLESGLGIGSARVLASVGGGLIEATPQRDGTFSLLDRPATDDS